jgi:hypothetical protein
MTLARHLGSILYAARGHAYRDSRLLNVTMFSPYLWTNTVYIRFSLPQSRRPPRSPTTQARSVTRGG